jgi:ADP-ribose pyrophosphatase YjhB (NUDIX family)
VLLVRERTDGAWARPGGWADPGLSAGQVAVKEMQEEAGLAVRPARLLALWDGDAQGMQPFAHAVYKACLACEPVDGTAELVPGPEALDAGWFDPASLPDLSLTRSTPGQIRLLVALALDPSAPAVFD